MKARLFFIDNIRWSMIILVLSMHASDTYSPFGNWYYTDRPPLQPADMPQYALMFAAGVLAARGRWLEQPLPRARVVLGIAALAASCAIWIGIVAFAVARPGEAARLNGGLNLPSVLKCLWEALVCVGMSYTSVAIYRKYFNGQGRAARFLSDNAFAVYLFHPPILVFCAILIHGAVMPGPAKAVLLTAMASLAAFVLSALILRRIPYLRRVL